MFVSGTKDWKVMIGDTATGPWNEIANGTFPDPRLTLMNVPLTVISLSGYYIPTGRVRKKSCDSKVY